MNNKIGEATNVELREITPKVGRRHLEGNYEYSYGQSMDEYNNWITVPEQEGWGVRVIDKTQTDYESPLITIHGYLVTSMAHLFCTSLSVCLSSPTILASLTTWTTLNLIGWDTSKVTNMSGMFCGNKARSVDLSDFDTSNVTDMSYMFRDSYFTNLDLSSFNTSKVTNMSGMFDGCSDPNVNLSSFDTSSVTNMNSMFNDSGNIYLNLNHFDTSKVTDMMYMFSGSSAMNFDLSSFDTSKVTTMAEMFFLIRIDVLDLTSFDTSNVKDVDGMFRCSRIKTLKARTQSDVNKYLVNGNIPHITTVTVES